MPQKIATITDHLDTARHEDAIKIKAHILLILRTLQQKRCQLSLSIKGNSEAFISIILDIDAENNWLELDEVADTQVHTALLETKIYLASAWQKGVNLRFAATITSHRESNGLIRYRSALPDTIYQSQLRAGYRTPISMMFEPEAHLILSDNQVIKGQISDISMNGALVIVPTDSPINAGDHIAQCIFKTFDNQMIIVEAEVLRSVDTEHNSRTKLGCRFINLDQSTKQDIQRYNAAIERFNARRR